MTGTLLHDPRRLAALLAEAKLDALVAFSAPNVRHLTRFGKPGAAAAVVTATEPEAPVLVVPASDVDFIVEDLAEGVRPRAFGTFFRFRANDGPLSAEALLVDRVHRECTDGARRAELIGDVLRDVGAAHGRIGVDAPWVAADELSRELPGARIIDATSVLRRLRAVKTAEEVERLRGAARIAERAIVVTVDVVAAGVTQAELAATYGAAVVADGAAIRMDNVSLGASTALGNANVPADVLRPGDLVRFDVGAVYRGYASDLSRCFALGEPGDKARRYHAALVDGQAAALAALRPGARAADVFAAGIAAVREAGIPHYARTNLGHGIGISGDGYDAPLLAPGDETLIEEGMVLCVETPYYELGFAGLQVEDMVRVTRDGWEPLSHLPRELRELA